MERYKGPITVQFDGIPPVNLVSVTIAESANWLQRIAEATRRRYFTLEKDWQLDLDHVDYLPELNGAIVIPRQVDGKTIVYDGASVPLPWLVSFLSIGILRPLGVMLIASIVHDFAFKFGYLLVIQKDQTAAQKVSVERHHTDHLFRDLIGTLNQLFIVGWLAWFFVRLGWFLGVKYNGRAFNGQPPYGVAAISMVAFGLLCAFLFASDTSASDRVELLVTIFAGFYFGFYFLTVLILKIRDARADNP